MNTTLRTSLNVTEAPVQIWKLDELMIQLGSTFEWDSIVVFVFTPMCILGIILK